MSHCDVTNLNNNNEEKPLNYNLKQSRSCNSPQVKSLETSNLSMNFESKTILTLGSPSMAELNHYLSEGENSNYRYNFAVPGLPKFLKFL